MRDECCRRLLRQVNVLVPMLRYLRNDERGDALDVVSAITRFVSS